MTAKTEKDSARSRGGRPAGSRHKTTLAMEHKGAKATTIRFKGSRGHRKSKDLRPPYYPASRLLRRLV